MATDNGGIFIKKHIISEVGGIKEFDPKMIVGIEVVSGHKSLKITVLTQPTTLNKKVEVEIPQIDFSVRRTTIDSVQLKEQDGVTTVFAEISGPSNPNAFFWVDILAMRMKKLGLVNAFFPAFSAHKNAESMDCYYGTMTNGKVSQWNSVLGVGNVRLLQGAILYSVGDTLFSAPFTGVGKKDWKSRAKILHRYEEGVIAFIGRVKDGCIPITIENGKTYIAEVGYSTMPSGKASKFKLRGMDYPVRLLLGHLGPAGIVAMTNKGGLIIMPLTYAGTAA